MSPFVLTRRAWRDIMDAAALAAERSGSVDAAERLLLRLEEHCLRLAAMPRMGRPRPDLGTRLRSHPVPPFVLYYRVHREHVSVVRVLHQKQDVLKAFPRGPRR